MVKSAPQKLKKQHPPSASPGKTHAQTSHRLECKPSEIEILAWRPSSFESLRGQPYLPGEESWEEIAWFDDVA